MHKRSNYSVNLDGTSKFVVSGIIDNNTASGLTTYAYVVESERGNMVETIRNKWQYYEWWKKTYGDVTVGDDTKFYIKINKA